MNGNIDRWHNIEEIQKYIGASRESVLNYISKRNMPAHKIGGRWKFKLSEVDEWVKSGKAN